MVNVTTEDTLVVPTPQAVLDFGHAWTGQLTQQDHHVSIVWLPLHGATSLTPP